MKLYRTSRNPVVEHEGRYYPIEGRSFDSLVCDEDLNYTLDKVVNGEAPAGDSGCRGLASSDRKPGGLGSWGDLLPKPQRAD